MNKWLILFILFFFENSSFAQSKISSDGVADLNGIWNAQGYICNGQYIVSELVKIELKEDKIKIIKVTGDNCIPAGGLSFSGSETKISGDPAPHTNFYTGIFYDVPLNGDKNGSLTTITINGILGTFDNQTGSHSYGSILFTRVSTPDCKNGAYESMVSSAQGLFSLADQLEKDDIFYYSCVGDMISRGYNSPYAVMSLDIPANDIPSYFKDETAIKAVRSQLVGNIRTKARNREKFGEIGIKGNYGQAVYSKETVTLFCDLNPQNYTVEFWDALWMAGYIDYDLYYQGEKKFIILSHKDYFENLFIIAQAIPLVRGVAALSIFTSTGVKFALSRLSVVALKSLAEEELPIIVLEQGTTVLKPLGLGSTGRTVANNLVEQTAMKNILENPQLGRSIIGGLKDDRWLGWTKMQYTVISKNGVTAVIHYVAKIENGELIAVDDFKFMGQ
jgi:hypothetical protein